MMMLPFKWEHALGFNEKSLSDADHFPFMTVTDAFFDEELVAIVALRLVWHRLVSHGWLDWTLINVKIFIYTKKWISIVLLFQKLDKLFFPPQNLPKRPLNIFIINRFLLRLDELLLLQHLSVLLIYPLFFIHIYLIFDYSIISLSFKINFFFFID